MSDALTGDNQGSWHAAVNPLAVRTNSTKLSDALRDGIREADKVEVVVQIKFAHPAASILCLRAESSLDARPRSITRIRAQ
jgi:hypothetical protein